MIKTDATIAIDSLLHCYFLLLYDYISLEILELVCFFFFFKILVQICSQFLDCFFHILLLF